MEHLTDRLVWLLIGIAIGWVLGRISVKLQSVEGKVDAVKEELDEVDGILKHRKDEFGRVSQDLIDRVALGVVVIVTLWAAVVSQVASNNAQSSVDSQAQTTKCTKIYLSKTIDALNERTEYTQQQATANVELQKAQGDFLGLLLHRPPYSKQRRYVAATRYVNKLTDFVKVSEKSKLKAENNPYPTPEEFSNCISSK